MTLSRIATAVALALTFAAPVLAGRYLQALTDAGFPSITDRRGLVPTGRRPAGPPGG